MLGLADFFDGDGAAALGEGRQERGDQEEDRERQAGGGERAGHEDGEVALGEDERLPERLFSSRGPRTKASTSGAPS